MCHSFASAAGHERGEQDHAQHKDRSAWQSHHKVLMDRCELTDDPAK
jgi:hypothetical protein